MDRFFPIQVLKTSLKLLVTQKGLMLVGINFVYMLIFGIINLLAGLFIFGPATFLLQGQHVFLWIFLPFLSLVFLILMIGLTLCIQFLIFLGLYRLDQNQTPILSIEIIGQQADRFKLYAEAAARAVLEVVLGLVFLIIPGVILLLKYFLIGPVAIYKYHAQLSAQDVLSKSAELSQGRRAQLGYLILGALIFYFFVLLLLGSFITRLIFAPFLLTYLAIVLVKYSQDIRG